MSISSYPNGFPTGITIRGLPIAMMHPGTVHWVNSTSVLPASGTSGADGNKGTYQQPFATIEGALNSVRVVESRGDVIMVMPGHTETVTTDGGIAIDKAGTAIVGLGIGTLRPAIILDAAAAAVTVTAANCSMKNVEVRASFADVTNGIDITAAWASFEEVEFTEEGANLNFVDHFHASSTTDNTADGLSIVNCVGTAIDTAQNSFLLSAADIDRLVVNDNFYSSFHANTLAMILITSPKTITDIQVLRNRCNVPNKVSGDILIDSSAADNTGIVGGNWSYHIDTASAVPVDCQEVGLFENYSNSTIATSGVLHPAADAV